MESIKPSRSVAYRVFAINDWGRLSGVPEIITAADDGDAVDQAERLLGSRAIEVWEGARLVSRIRCPLIRSFAGRLASTNSV